MRPSRHAVLLEETDTEFLLGCHPELRDRVKRLGGAKWDAGRRRWVLAKTGKAWDAIIAEFRDDMLPTVVLRPGSLPIEPPPAIKRTEPDRTPIEALKEDVGRANEEALTALRSHVKTLESMLEARVKELVEVKGQLQERADAREQALSKYFALARQHDDLKHGMPSLLEEARRSGSQDALMRVDRADWLREEGARATANDPLFRALLQRLTLDSTLPTSVAAWIEQALRVMLDCQDRTVSFFNLIASVQAAGLLPEDGIGLLHFIRKHRNRSAHELIDLSESTALMHVSLFALCLFWRHLPEQARRSV